MNFSSFGIDPGSVSFFVTSFVSLFVIVDAIGIVPIFISLLERFDEGERKSIVKKAVLVACASLIVVTLTGNLSLRKPSRNPFTSSWSSPSWPYSLAIQKVTSPTPWKRP